MRGERLLSGYILRVAVRRNRWFITLVNVRTGAVKTFDSFAALEVYLERASARQTQPGCSHESEQRC